ncbi:hypothetical protein AVEN_231321-1 [Araneus ventricosus]|uniref:Uncharacterized protein n=1 Tax=Araneus ventricosus TaxID=182803 RepID=A0A4Y2CKN9_ARAVE|nr:hypothetical protein AVEN_231321-1 [Araneus ventricosus]
MAVLSTSISISLNLALKTISKSVPSKYDRIDGTFRKRDGEPSFSSKSTLFNSRTNQFIMGHGPFVPYLHRLGLCSHDRCVCGAEADPNHYATVCLVTKLLHFTKSSSENLSTWCENIVQDKRSLARLMNIMKILYERRPWIKKDFSGIHHQLRLSLQSV